MKRTHAIDTMAALRRTLSGLTFFLLVLAVLPARAQAQEQWQRVPWVTQAMRNQGLAGGEGGQWGQAIAISTDASLLLFGTDVGGISRSLDGGVTWTPCNLGYQARGNAGFAIDPRNSNRVLAVGGNSAQSFTQVHGLYLSTDKGASWRIVKAVDDYCGYRDIREQVAFDPASYDAAAGYAKVAYWSRAKAGYCVGGAQTGSPGLYKSTDGGESWQLLPNTAAQGDATVKLHPTNGTLYLGNASGLYKSTDGGNFFQKIFSAAVAGLDVVASQPDKVYVMASDGLYVSGNQGAAFQKVTSATLPASAKQFLNVSPLNPLKMVVQVIRGDYDTPHFYSHDGGLSWSEVQVDVTTNRMLPYNGGRLSYVAWSPVAENHFWLAGSDCVEKSSNGGQTQAWANNGLTAVCGTATPTFSHFNPDIWCMGTRDYNGAISLDAGSTWKYLNVSGFGFGGFVYGLYSPDGQTIVAGNATEGDGNFRYIAVSKDGGNTFNRTQTRITGQASAYGDPHDPDVLFLGEWRSTDGGTTWNKMAGCDGVFTHSPTGQRELYGTNANAVAVSYDRGASWITLGDVPYPISSVAVDHRQGLLYVACRDYGLFTVKLTTGAVTNISNLIPQNQIGTQRYLNVAVDPLQPAVVYAGGPKDIYNSDASVVRSTDGGQTWQVLTATPRLGNYQFGVSPGEGCFMRVNPKTRELFLLTGCYGNWKIGSPAIPADSTLSASLAITDVSWSPSAPLLGETVTFTARVKNRGTVAVSGSIAVQLTVGGTVLPGTLTYDQPIAAGQTVALTGLTWPAAGALQSLQARLSRGPAVLHDYYATLRVRELVPPTAPANLRADALEDVSVSLSWDAATDNVKLSAYAIYNGNVLAGSISALNTAYTVTGLVKSTDYTFTVVAVDASGNQTAGPPLPVKTAASPYLLAIQAAQPPQLDGKLTEPGWKLFKNIAKQEAGSGYSDNKGKVFAQWTADSLYIGVQVQDNLLFNDFVYYAPQNDAVELFIDSNHDKAYSYGPNEVAFGKIPDGDLNNPLAPVYELYKMNGGLDASVIRTRSFVSTGSYSMEIAIPWNALGVNAQAGRIIGFDAAINDSDSYGVRNGYVLWKGFGGNFYSSNQLGELLLVNALDTLPPAKPANLRTTALSSTALDLTWDVPSDNAGVTQYALYQNGTLLSNSLPLNRYHTQTLEPLATYRYNVIAYDAFGNASTVSDTFRVMMPDHLKAVAYQSGAAIRVDGILSETDWNLYHAVGKKVQGNSDNVTTFGTVWTADTLYVGIRVVDPNRYNNNLFYTTDAVEVYLDARQERAGAYDANDRQFVQVWSGGLFGSNGSGVVSRSYTLPDNQGYSVELSVPWSNLGITPAPGMLLGFDIANDDDDNGSGRSGQTLWNGNDDNYQNTRAFGRLELRGGNLPLADLQLTSMCSADPSVSRRWRVTSTYNQPVSFTWEVYGTPQHGSGIVNAYETLYFDTQTVPGTPNTVKIFYDGKAQVKASSGSSCSGRSAAAGASFGDVSGPTLAVYPNPASGQFAFRYNSPAAETVSVSVRDVLDRPLTEQSWVVARGQNTRTVPCAQWAPGVYFVRVQTPAGRIWIRRMVLTR